MRPDEHKKKKNDQYKKKHGIKSVKDKVVKNQDKPGSGAKQTPVHAVKSKAEDKLLSDEGEEEISVERQFSRRKVESNWHRYEADAEETGKGLNQASPSGADFKQLLTHKASSSAQFRFKGEQLWEDVEIKQPPQLSVDCDDLLTAVVCVPLHERLDIDPLHFEKFHLDVFEETAKQCTHSYDKKHKEKRERLETGKKENTSPECNTGEKTESEPVVKETTSEETSTNKSEKEFNPTNIVGKVVISDTESETKDGLSEEQQTDDSQVIISETNIADDLDELLGVCDNSTYVPSSSNSNGRGEPSKPALTETAVSGLSPTPVPTTNLEDQLDELLNLDQLKDTSSKQVAANNSSQVTTSTRSTGDNRADVGSSLEDWLDDILDD